MTTVTNEDAAIQAKTGDKTMIEFLWVSNQGIIKRNVFAMVDNPIDRQDFMQEAYFALVKAIDVFNPSAGFKFSTWLNKSVAWHLWRYRKKQNNHGIAVLNAPIGEDSENERMDFLADEHALAPEAAAEQSDLSRIMEQSLARLPTMNEQCVRRQYFQAQSVRVIAQQTGVQEATARARVTEGLRKLRRNPRLKEISNFYCQAYHGTGIGSYRSHFETSSVERLALKHLEEQERLHKYFRGEVDDY